MPSRIKHRIQPDFSEGVDRKQLRQIRDRFLRINQQRLEKTYDGLGTRSRDILKILPFLYQVNHPLIPGYVSKETPRGVAGYMPDKETLSIAAGFSRTFRYRPDRRHKPQIQSLFAMGSAGTLAHSESSDVDVWLCIGPDLHPDEEHMLRVKAERIDTWANAEGLELHTFLMCAKRFKGEQGVPEMDSESSGSAQHYLLLDEFYRTAILLAGCYPLWWLVPPAMEGNFEDVCTMLLGQRFIKEKEIIDFGSTSHIPKSEMVGAGMWQLYKSLDSPYKSVLKLLLAEVYAKELPEYPSLSVEFKLAVYEDELEVEQLDPYYLMYRRLENYLSRAHDDARIELVRKSFYLKVNKKLSQTVRGRKPSWQRQFLQKIVEKWSWNPDELRYLDNRSQWKVSDVLEERQALLTELTEAYRFLTAYARANQIGSSITQQDMNLLGRKLYAIFQRKAGKVERINPGIAPDMWEENLALHHASTQEFQTDTNAWLLYKDLTNAGDAAFTQPLRKSSNLIELLAWLYFNDIISRATRISLVPGQQQLTVKDIHSSLACLEEVFPKPLPSISQNMFRSTPRVTKILLVANLGVNPVQDINDEGVYRVSDRVDSLSYSTRRTNLVKTIDQVVMNSWGEVSAIRYEVGETLLQTLQAYLQLCFTQLDRPFSLHVRCFSPLRSTAVEGRIRQLFESVKHAYFGLGTLRTLRYVLEIEHSYYVLQYKDEQFRFTRVDSLEDLRLLLATSDQIYRPIVVDEYALPDQAMIKASLPLSSHNSVQVFYSIQGDVTEICVIDEFGSILHVNVPAEDEGMLQSSIYNFLMTILDRRLLSQDTGLSGIPDIVFYKMQRSSKGKLTSTRLKRIPLLEVAPVSAIGVYAGDDLNYDLHYRGIDFRFQDYGEQQAAALMHRHQAGNVRESIPLKLVDLSFPADPMGIRRTQEQGYGTLDYLRTFFHFDAQFKLAMHEEINAQG